MAISAGPQLIGELLAVRVAGVLPIAGTLPCVGPVVIPAGPPSDLIRSDMATPNPVGNLPGSPERRPVASCPVAAAIVWPVPGAAAKPSSINGYDPLAWPMTSPEFTR